MDTRDLHEHASDRARAADLGAVLVFWRGIVFSDWPAAVRAHDVSAWVHAVLERDALIEDETLAAP